MAGETLYRAAEDAALQAFAVNFPGGNVCPPFAPCYNDGMERVINDHPLLRTLNPQQQEAVSLDEGPALVLAGPGSGKTRVLTYRIAWMVEELWVRPWNILAVTFTNKAAREMRERVSLMEGRDVARAMTIGTFHATCARILRREAELMPFSADYLIFDADDQRSLMKSIVREMGLDEKRYPPRALLAAISRAKNELVGPDEYPVRTYYDEIVVRAYRRYEEALRSSNALDFDDLLMETVDLFRHAPEVLARYRERYRHILVDEFQDTNVAQYVLLRLLAQEHRSLFVVADEDQSIYSWRGADYRNIRRLRRDFPELREVLLEENYRSTQIILDAAQRVIARNPDRTPKRLFTRKQGGSPIVLRELFDEQSEADFVATTILSLHRRGYRWGDIAVMYRANAQSRVLEETFVHRSIPYRLVGATRFYARREIKDILAYLRLAQNPRDDVSFLRVLNTPPRGLGARTVEKIAARAQEAFLSRYEGTRLLLHTGILRGRQQRALEQFLEMVEGWHRDRDRLPVVALLDRILAETGYESYLRDGTQEGESRWENVLTLRSVLADSPEIKLADFLTEVALVADVDALDDEQDAVTLLTLHSAKGLEYRAVFLVGVEEGLLPHRRSLEESPEALAEERRLFYVGMTRAKERLYLTYVFRRSWYGGDQPGEPSRFLADIPDDLLQRQERPTGKLPKPSRFSMPWKQGAAAPKERRFHEGERVRHRRFGLGRVLESRLEDGYEIVTVIFNDNGIGVKHFLAEKAPLEPVSEF